jgi:hypothetical protein
VLRRRGTHGDRPNDDSEDSDVDILRSRSTPPIATLAPTGRLLISRSTSLRRVHDPMPSSSGYMSPFAVASGSQQVQKDIAQPAGY